MELLLRLRSIRVYVNGVDETVVVAVPEHREAPEQPEVDRVVATLDAQDARRLSDALRRAGRAIDYPGLPPLE